MNTSKKKKQVTFRLDADGYEWCSVIGESLENFDEEFDNRYVIIFDIIKCHNQIVENYLSVLYPNKYQLSFYIFLLRKR